MTLQDKNSPKTHESIPLKELVNYLIEIYQPVAVKQNCFIINDVPESFSVTTDETLLASLSCGLFSAILSRSRNSCIRVSARLHNNVVLLNIWTNDGGDFFQSVCSIQEIKALAEKLGGCVSLNHMRKTSNTITISFINLSAAA